MNKTYTTEEITRTIYKLVDEQVSHQQTVLDETTTFVEDLGMDSLDTIEYIMAVEEEFVIEIQDEQAEKVVTIGDAVRLVQELLEHRFDPGAPVVPSRLDEVLAEPYVKARSVVYVPDKVYGVCYEGLMTPHKIAMYDASNGGWRLYRMGESTPIDHDMFRTDLFKRNNIEYIRGGCPVAEPVAEVTGIPMPYDEVGDAREDSALLTNADGYDVARLEPINDKDLPADHPRLSGEAWQRLIDVVDGAPAMLEAMRQIHARLSELAATPEFAVCSLDVQQQIVFIKALSYNSLSVSDATATS